MILRQQVLTSTPPPPAYGAAVAASCSLAIGLGRVAQKIQPKNVSPIKGALIRASVPYCAVVGGLATGGRGERERE